MVSLDNALEYVKEKLSKCPLQTKELVDRFLKIFQDDEITSQDPYPTLSIYFKKELGNEKHNFLLVFSIHYVEHSDDENNEQDLTTYSTTLSLNFLLFSPFFQHSEAELFSFQKTNSPIDQTNLENLLKLRNRLIVMAKENDIHFRDYTVTLTHEN